MQTILINGKNYAAGLWWQVSDSIGNGRRKDVLAAARLSAAQQAKEGYNCVLLRKHQFGLGCADKFQPLPALASALHPKELPFVGIFRVSGDTIGSFWWLCAITKGGFIAGDGDMLYEDREIALRRVHDLLPILGNITLSYDCSTSEESALALTPLLHSDGKLERLYPDPRQKRVGLMALAVITALGTGWYAYDYYVTEQAEQLRRAQMLAMQKAQQGKRSEAQSNIERYFPKHWEKSPTVQNIAEQCLPVLYDTPSIVRGWLLDSSLCQKSTLVHTWIHTQGASYTNLPDKAILQSNAPTKALATHALPATPPARGALAHELLSKTQVTGHLYQITQDVGAILRPQWANAESTSVEGVVLMAPWVRCTWELASVPNAGLATLLALLDAVPALTLESILLQNNTWILKGSVYATQ